MKLFELARQRQWLAGYESESMEPFYFDCADCGAKGPIIKGFLGKSTKYADIAVFTRGESKDPRAFLCQVLRQTRRRSRRCATAICAPSQSSDPSSAGAAPRFEPPMGAGKEQESRNRRQVIVTCLFFSVIGVRGVWPSLEDRLLPRRDHPSADLI